MALDKLPVPNIRLETGDFGTIFQQKMNQAMQAMRDSVTAYNNQIDAAQTAMQYTEPAPLDIALTGINDTYKMTPAKVRAAYEQYGLGANIAPRVLDNNDFLNFNIRQGIYGVAPNVIPGLSGAVNVIVGKYNHTNSMQNLFFLPSRRLLHRGFGAAGATELVEYYSTLNVVGAVSQSNGIPSGALFQRGETPAGEFYLNAMGQLECSIFLPKERFLINDPNAVTVVQGVSYYRSLPINWTYPTQFAPGTTPKITIQPCYSAGGVRFANSNYTSANASGIFNIQLISPESPFNSEGLAYQNLVGVNVIATGRKF